jgi:hypothetical protein
MHTINTSAAARRLRRQRLTAGGDAGHDVRPAAKTAPCRQPTGGPRSATHLPDSMITVFATSTSAFFDNPSVLRVDGLWRNDAFNHRMRRSGGPAPHLVERDVASAAPSTCDWINSSRVVETDTGGS